MTPGWDIAVSRRSGRTSPSPRACLLYTSFVFDNVAKSESMSGTGPEQQKIADMMSESWLAFAKTSDPNNAEVPHWPAYDVQSRATMIFDVKPRVENDPRAKDRALFKRAPVNA